MLYYTTPSDHCEYTLRIAFPRRDWLLDEIACAITSSTAAAALAPPSTPLLGLTVEYAIGLDLCTTLPYPEVFERLPLSDARRAAHRAGFSPTTDDATKSPRGWPRQKLGEAADLHDVAAMLAFTQTSLAVNGRELEVHDARRMLEWPSVFDSATGLIAAQRPVFAAYDSDYRASIRDRLRELGDVIAEPRLARLRTGDLLAGDTLVEVKTRQLNWPEDREKLIDQVLEYALLCRHAQEPVGRVAIYLARFGAFMDYPLDEFLDRLTVHSADLDRLAREHYQRILDASNGQTIG